MIFLFSTHRFLAKTHTIEKSLSFCMVSLNEKDNQFDAIIGSLSQTFDGNLLYGACSESVVSYCQGTEVVVTPTLCISRILLFRWK